MTGSPSRGLEGTVYYRVLSGTKGYCFTSPPHGRADISWKQVTCISPPPSLPRSLAPSTRPPAGPQYSHPSSDLSIAGPEGAK